ncbi:MAG: nucleotide exchange factor GrpE [Lentisphaerae bacterium]|nr:nucleotide exchange factor GrpE [Lentisphaerota bacterium]
MSKHKEKDHSHEDAGHQPALRSLDEAGTTAPDTEAAAPGPTAQAQPADVAPAPAPAEGERPTEKLEQLQDQLLRLRADFDNFRKRTLREKTELFERANQELMLELLPILDHLHLGLQAASAHQADPAFREGLQLIFDQLMGTLSKWGRSPPRPSRKGRCWPWSAAGICSATNCCVRRK